MSGLHGRRAIVTGGSRGIGRAVAAALSGAGADVTILGRSVGALDEAVAAGVARAGRAVDVTDADALQAAIADVASKGPVAILVNNAGTARSGRFETQDIAVFADIHAQHLMAPVVAARTVLPGMQQTGFGRIVNIASTASLVGYPFLTAYTAAKHALLGLTRALALEVVRSGVTVNAVCPGFTETDLVREGMAQRAEKAGRAAGDVMAEFSASKPLGRLVRPDEVAATVLWLVSDAAAAVTGQAIVVDGGETVA